MNKWDKIKKKDLKSLGEAPQEVSENIQAPELAPRDNRFTGRTKRIAFTCRPEFAEELRRLAFENRCYQIEILEKAMEMYKKNLLSETKNNSLAEYEKTKNQLNNKKRKQIFPGKKTIQKSTQTQLNRFVKIDFICDKCQKKFIRDVVYSPAPNLDQLKNYPTCCVDCGENEVEEETCSFREVDDKTNHYLFCGQPLFDKKKQLCRSHNKQVWKRFNEFTKDMSVSSTAAWLETWEQSRDWKYWWNLREENKLET